MFTILTQFMLLKANVNTLEANLTNPIFDVCAENMRNKIYKVKIVVHLCKFRLVSGLKLQGLRYRY